MAPQPQRPDGKTFLAAVTTVAAVYVYFLIFAQFGFLRAVEAAWGGAEGVVHSILGGMGLAGIVGSVIAARVFAPGRGARLMATGWALCALAAGGTPWADSIAEFSVMALCTGLGVGLLTVTLAGVLRPATGDGRLGLIIGLGTGLAYGFCNLPGVFDASIATQARLALAAAVIGFGASRALGSRFGGEPPRTGDFSRAGIACWVLVFLALVGLDSALFHFIQHTPELKQALWTGAGQQGLNAAVHAGAAALAGWALDRRWGGRTVWLAAGALLAAGWWIGGRHAGYAAGALIYIASVSAYSTALVYYPVCSGRPAVAALVYAIAGWGGSAAGIGLAEGRADWPAALTVGAAALLAAGLMGRYFASRQGPAMNKNTPRQSHAHPPPTLNDTKGPIRRFFSRQLTRRHGGLLVFFGVFLALSFLTRLVLLVKAASDVTWTLSLVAAFGWGVLFDLGAAGFAALPLLFLLTLLPAGWFKHRWEQWLAHGVGFIVIYLLLFNTVAEWVFWDEFGVRFNFIAVDYLVYTTEVIGNIRESYNLPLIFGGLAAASAAAYWLCWRTGYPRRWAEAAAHEPFKSRLTAGGAWLAGILVFGTVLNETQLPAFRNNFNRELAKDGLWSLFAAFRNNELDYDQFYQTRTPVASFQALNEELVEDGSVLLRPGELDTLRYVRNDGPELRPNVIQITVESLSADFLGIFNRASGLTPNLTEIAAQSLVFDAFYATGTRTDRGMEALTLSMPPTPGRSIVKRPRNEGLFTLGSVFRAKGYDTAFIYGGFGYFDNMNYFFGHNGYRVIDRTGVPKEDITFANVWGVCDEDLFRWTLREADTSAATGKPFHYFVMTTSNHRPYTFPEGRIDLPSKVSGRAGAVKYTDYAIGKFLRDAATKPWFRNTVFVIVADHCASSAGRTELPVQNYHIPLIIYSPGGHIAPGHIRTLTSQMDYAPTLLGLLNWSYPSRFFGHDVRKIDPAEAHALIGSYQKLGHLENGNFVVLSPQRGATAYHYDLKAKTQTPQKPGDYDLTEAISFYEAASHMYKHGLYRELTPEEFARFTAQGQQLLSPGKAATRP